MDFDKLLQLMVKEDASDLFITVGVPPSIKVNGQILPIGKKPLTGSQCMTLIKDTMTEDQIEEFEKTKECQFAITNNLKSARFRVSAFLQRGEAGMVLRTIKTKIPTIEELKLPRSLKDIAMIKRGIVLIVGGTGSGKSTTMAALLGYRNVNSRGHIVTIEDPIEFLHEHKGCIITQREVGIDTDSFEIGLSNTLRQAPDVICIGEIRNKEVMNYAIQYAETGHLVFATLHANNANQAIDRIIHFFEADRHDKVLMDMSLNLRAIIAQQLVPTQDGRGRRVATEIMLNSQLISQHIRNGDIHEIKPLMERGREVGMQTFDHALYELYESGTISYEEAMKHADSANDLRLKIRTYSKRKQEAMEKERDTVILH